MQGSLVKPKKLSAAIALYMTVKHDIIDWFFVYNCSDVNTAWQLMKAIIIGVYDRYAPVVLKE